jgi:Sulfotransferase family
MADIESATVKATSRVQNRMRRLDPEALMAAALRRSGQVGFLDSSFVDPLKRLLQAYDDEAELSLFGRYAASFDVMRCLGNLLRLEAAERADAAIARRTVVQPIFITGLPRSSTTFLHTLLAQDPANIVPQCWQLIYPYPPRRRLFRTDFRKTRVDLQFRVFRFLSPGLDGLHQLTAETPQECTDITAHVFQSLRFDSTHRIPSYQSWLDAHGHHEAYRFHRRFLQHLNGEGRRWVLKSPDHVFALDAIRAVYPDGHIVFLHRDPLSVIASCAKLTEMLRRPFTRRIDRREIGRQVSSRLIESADLMVEAAAQPNRILHLHYKQVVSAPMETVAALYRHCGITLDHEAERRMRAWMQRNSARPRRQRYSFEEYGLDPAFLRERFSRYITKFGISSEWTPAQDAV